MRRTLAVGIFAAVALTACGGQTAAPGSPTSPPVPPTTPASVSLSKVKGA